MACGETKGKCGQREGLSVDFIVAARIARTPVVHDHVNDVGFLYSPCPSDQGQQPQIHVNRCHGAGSMADE